LKFLVDMPLSPELAVWLRMQGHDAVHAGEIALARAPDIEILNAAIHESRVVITADLDFPRLLALLGTPGPGLLLLRGGNFTESECRDRVGRVLSSIPDDDLARCIVVVDRERIRRRWLPL
jgi:predicted nuclease of predicted toxin-antitoxin system